MPQSEGYEEVNPETVEVFTAPAPSPKGSTFAEKRTKTATVPISEQAVAGGLERGRDDDTSESAGAERLPAVKLDAANDSHFAEANPRIVASDDIDHEVEVEKGAAVVDICVCHNDNTFMFFIDLWFSPRAHTRSTLNQSDLIPLPPSLQ